MSTRAKLIETVILDTPPCTHNEKAAEKWIVRADRIPDTNQRLPSKIKRDR
ncbi:MAG TPA: hypothetical protein VN901_00945 [Candidatus Acidoferrales bacterium]|nr:hypothetical protein [Candidatus Acidoferrales bacterium]